MVKLPFFGRKSNNSDDEHAERFGTFTDALGNEYVIDKPSDLKKVQSALSVLSRKRKTANTIKEYQNNSWANALSQMGLTTQNRDISTNNFGYATAYTSIWYIRAAVDLYAQMAQDIPSEIVYNKSGKPENDKVVATSDDVSPQHIWYQVKKDNRVEFGVNVIPAMVYQLMLFDELYIEKRRNQFTRGGGKKGYPTGIRVLNTLGVTVNRNYGGDPDEPITSFQYGWDNEHETLAPDDVAYEHGFNPFDDLSGSSIIQSVIDQLNVDRNLNRFLNAFFTNNAIPHLVGSPKENNLGGLNQAQIAELKQILKDHHKGVSNSFKTLITNIPVDWQQLDPPQIQQFTEMQKGLQKQTFAAFRVNPALVGYAEDTSYKDDIPQIEAQFVKGGLKPVLSQIESVINDSILPFLTGSTDFRFRFKYDKYTLVTEQDVLALELEIKRLNSGAISLSDYQERNGLEPIKEFENLFMIDGVPVPVSEIPNLWKAKFPTYTEPMLDDGKEDDASEPTETSEPPETDMEDGEGDEETTKSADIITYEDCVKHFYQPLPTKAEKIAELETWRKFVDNGSFLKRAFVPSALHGDVADAIQAVIDDKADKSMVLDEIDSQIEAIKSIASTRIDYELAVEDLIEQSRNGDITKRIFQTKMMQSIRGYGKLAFIDGLRDGGVTAEPDDEEKVYIETHVVKQRQYVNNLADKIYAKEKAITDAQAEQKPSMWYSKSISPLYEAGKMSAEKNAMMEWVYGDADHCSDCIQLNGQRHRMKTFFSKGILPRSDLLSCNGFNCKCSLIRTDGSARGRLPNL